MGAAVLAAVAPIDVATGDTAIGAWLVGPERHLHIEPSRVDGHVTWLLLAEGERLGALELELRDAAGGRGTELHGHLRLDRAPVGDIPDVFGLEGAAASLAVGQLLGRFKQLVEVGEISTPATIDRPAAEPS